MKKLLFFLFVTVSPLHAANTILQQTAYPSAAQSLQPGATFWLTPTNVFIEDNIVSTASIGILANSEFLASTSYGFYIPSNAIILGVKAEVKKAQQLSVTVDGSVVLYDNFSSTVGFVDHADTVNEWPFTLTWFTYGSSTDTWGMALTPTIVNSPNFGLGFQAKHASSVPKANIDVNRITIFYGVPTTIYNGKIYNGTIR